MPRISLPVPRRRQGKGAECLAACAAMVLDYLNAPLPYDTLLNILEIRSFGAPRRNILTLNRHGVKVIYREATLDLLIEYLESALPVIAFVDTGELFYWKGKEQGNHAVVVIGIADDTVLVNDPEFEQAPQGVPVDEFMLAWQECDNTCAVVSLE